MAGPPSYTADSATPGWCRIQSRITGDAVNGFGKSARADFRRRPTFVRDQLQDLLHHIPSTVGPATGEGLNVT